MNLLLQLSKVNSHQSIRISGSKSETNRLLLLQALYPQIILENTSDSDDSEVMLKALSGDEKNINIHHAGTAMRFLTAYFAIRENKEVIITGSPRMQERPISILVDALRQLGAEIKYEANEGFPPLRITGKKLTKNKIAIHANVSSQYISALLLIAPALENGLELTLEGTITSIPYINMTLALLHEAGVKASFEGNKIVVKPASSINITLSAVEGQNPTPITVESDWSSASYFYSIIALSNHGTEIKLSSYKKTSFQGDSALVEIYKSFGIETIFEKDVMILRKSDVDYLPLEFDLNHTPDIAQTIAVTCFGLGISCHLTGLHTLKIKETDRLTALHTELTKLGAKVTITNDSLTLKTSDTINPNIKIATYYDHRMAMAFAPLALRIPIEIEDAEVVSKSYPSFWNDLKSIGFQTTSI
jgi:3-phosphoshikimate 1-carboxyvinyltransferase